MKHDEIKAQLRQLPIEASVAFAVRVGLRVLPWLALSKDRQVLARWPEADRAVHLLHVLLAYDVGLMAVWDRMVAGLIDVARARRVAATAAAADKDYLPCFARESGAGFPPARE